MVELRRVKPTDRPRAKLCDAKDVLLVFCFSVGVVSWCFLCVFSLFSVFFVCKICFPMCCGPAPGTALPGMCGSQGTDIAVA